MDITKINQFDAELKELFEGVPFGNSTFQSKYFVIAAQMTPARAYRTISLKLNSLYKSLKEHAFDRREKKAEINHVKSQLKRFWVLGHKRKMLEIKLDRLEFEFNATDKVLADAWLEFEFFYSELKKYPKYTREDFESEERKYFEISLTRQAQGLTGPQQSLCNMQSDYEQLEAQREDAFLQMAQGHDLDLLAEIEAQ